MRYFFSLFGEWFKMCSGTIRGFEPQGDIPRTKREAVNIWFSIILRMQIFSAVLKDGLTDPVGFDLFSLRSKHL
jgi:hypothetical protein